MSNLAWCRSDPICSTSLIGALVGAFVHLLDQHSHVE